MSSRIVTVECTACGGRGYDSHEIDHYTCPWCDGRGDDFFGGNCFKCGGGGQLIENTTCKRCNGNGTITERQFDE